MRILSFLISVCLSVATAHPFSHTPTIYQRQVPGLPEGVEPMDNVFPRTYVDKTCTDEEKAIMKTAWDEAKLLADAATNIVSGYDYNVPYTQWFGDDWNVKGNSRAELRTKLITNNFRRLRKVFRGDIKKSEYFIWWCKDDLGQCTGQTQAATWRNKKRDGQRWIYLQETVLCPLFMNGETLGEQIARYENDEDEKEQIQIDNLEENTAQTMLHEIFHYGIVSKPQTLDHAEAAELNNKLAREAGTKMTFVNADSYAFVCLAIYVHQTFQTSMPPVPWLSLHEDTPEPEVRVSDENKNPTE
jgi:hypothetical protein